MERSELENLLKSRQLTGKIGWFGFRLHYINSSLLDQLYFTMAKVHPISPNTLIDEMIRQQYAFGA